MDKTSRLNLIRQRAAARPALSTEAADVLDTLRASDPDLGAKDAWGLLPAESVERVSVIETDDENEADLQALSPNMRANEEFAKQERSRFFAEHD